MSSKIESDVAPISEEATSSNAQEVILPDEANRADEPRVSGRRSRMARGRRPVVEAEEAQPEPESEPSPTKDEEVPFVVTDDAAEEEGEDGLDDDEEDGDEIVVLGAQEESADTNSAAGSAMPEPPTPAAAPAPKSRADRFAALAAKKREEESKVEAAKATSSAAPSRAGRLALLKDKKPTLLDTFKRRFETEAPADVLRAMFPDADTVVKANAKEFDELRDFIGGALGFKSGHSQKDAEGMYYMVVPECDFARVVEGNCYNTDNEKLSYDPVELFYPLPNEELISEKEFLVAFYTPNRICSTDEAESLTLEIVDLMFLRMQH